jgi:hypothetical protein
MSIPAGGIRRISKQPKWPPDKSQEEVSMSENTKRQMIVTMLAEGNPVWYVAAMVNMRSHDVYVIGCAAGYPDKVKLRRAVWAQRQLDRQAA